MPIKEFDVFFGINFSMMKPNQAYVALSGADRTIPGKNYMDFLYVKIIY